MENETRNVEEELKTMAKYIQQYCNDVECDINQCIFFTEQDWCGFDTPPACWNLED